MGAILDGIRHLDLSMVKRKLMDPHEGEGWSQEFVDVVEDEYRKFLSLTRAYPESAIVPSGPVDKFWHNHILDTQAYAVDCDRVFGFFLHHFPYFGMRGEQDEANLSQAWLETLITYRKHFGEPPEGLWSAGMRCPKCGRVAPLALPRELPLA